MHTTKNKANWFWNFRCLRSFARIRVFFLNVIFRLNPIKKQMFKLINEKINFKKSHRFRRYGETCSAFYPKPQQRFSITCRCGYGLSKNKIIVINLDLLLIGTLHQNTWLKTELLFKKSHSERFFFEKKEKWTSMLKFSCLSSSLSLFIPSLLLTSAGSSSRSDLCKNKSSDSSSEFIWSISTK